MSRPKQTLPAPAEPRLGRNFDPWNSSASGHQRAETRGPVGWRDARNAKLRSQFAAGNTGGQRIDDEDALREAASGRRRGLVGEGQQKAVDSVVDMCRKAGTMRRAMAAVVGQREEEEHVNSSCKMDELDHADAKADADADADEPAGRKQTRAIFAGLCIYVNGSTHPLISDHRLKQLLTEHGARMSIHHGRRQVTHVILGRPSSGPGAGAGGGLAGGKLEKEIRRGRGCGVRYVGVEWILESIRAGKRLPEARFANLKLAMSRQPSVLGTFSSAAGSVQRAVGETEAKKL